MIAALFDPFRTLAVWLVSLLPQGAGEQATGIAVLFAIAIVFLLLTLPACVLGAWLERHDRRNS